MTRFLTLFDTAVTDPLEDIPTVNELEKWLKNVGEQAFYFLIRLAAAGLLLFIGSKLIKFLMNRFKRSKLYQKMDPGLASFMASGSRIVLYIILILMCFGAVSYTHLDVYKRQENHTRFEVYCAFIQLLYILVLSLL